MLRRVQYYETKHIYGEHRNERTLKGEAYFHQFGNTYEQFNDGVGNMTTAIIELDDGTLIEVLPTDIVFMDKPI